MNAFFFYSCAFQAASDLVPFSFQNTMSFEGYKSLKILQKYTIKSYKIMQTFSPEWGGAVLGPGHHRGWDGSEVKNCSVKYWCTNLNLSAGGKWPGAANFSPRSCVPGFSLTKMNTPSLGEPERGSCVILPGKSTHDQRFPQQFPSPSLLSEVSLHYSSYLPPPKFGDLDYPVQPNPTWQWSNCELLRCLISASSPPVCLYTTLVCKDLITISAAMLSAANK